MTDVDAVIVGSGPAGATAAEVLTAAGWSVTILEKGRNHLLSLDDPFEPLGHVSNDEIKFLQRHFLGPDPLLEPRTFRRRVEELAWRTRIEGSRGIPEREFNGPVPGWQADYRAGVAALGADFTAVPGPEQDARLDAVPEFKALVYRHACEGAYGAPEYGGNRDARGWDAIRYPGDVQPRGYTDEEVAGRA